MVAAPASVDTGEDRRPAPWSLLFAPDRAVDAQARVGRTLGLLLVAWVCSLLLASALAFRVDARSETLRKFDASGELRTMSDRQISDETRKADRLFQVASIAKGVVVPPLLLGLNALALLGLVWFLRGRVKGRAVGPVAAAVMLPGAIADLLDAASAFRHAVITPGDVVLSPRTLGAALALAGHPLSPPWSKLANVPDIFSFWAAVLMAYGVSAVGQVPKRRALIGTVIAWLCYRLLTQVAIGG